MGPDHQRPTLQQVALHAGVSRSTAGAALAGSSRVARSTVERVRSSALKLGYRTQPHAQHLRRGGPELASVLLDTRLTHAEDGSLHPFWSRVITGFLARMQEHGWLCVVQLQQPGLPRLTAAAPGVIMATGDRGQMSLLVHDTFGQRVLSPVDDDEDHLHMCLHHDFAAIGTACADYLAQAGCRRVLLLGRTGFAYSEAILGACRIELDRRGLGLGTSLHDVDGLLDLAADPAGLARTLGTREVVPAAPQPGQIVVLTNADGPAPGGRPAIARLSLEGHAVGKLAAEFFLAGIERTSDLRAPQLPFVIHPPA